MNLVRSGQQVMFDVPLGELLIESPSEPRSKSPDR